MKGFRILLFVTGILMLPVGAVITWLAALRLSGQMAGSLNAFRFSLFLHAVSCLLLLGLGLLYLRCGYLILLGNAAVKGVSAGIKPYRYLLYLTLCAGFVELIRLVNAGGNISLFMVLMAVEVLLSAAAYYLTRYLRMG